MSESKQEGKSSEHLLKLVKEKQREALLKKAKSQNTALQQDPTNSQKNTKVENTGNNGAEKVGAGGQADGKKSKKGNFGSKLSSGYYEYKMDDYKQNRGGYLIPNKVEDDGGVRFVKETPEVILSDRAPLVVEEVRK
ncbi:hypothetical protein AX774_g6832 [Zancudomyces culisetae]|uniref:Uncharacterized protein n=1 Tax=Zancudomyces culisetae TaxID=1213189 RepID=A0A1R1PFQ1_ZANCU|nr:hypothetical protein AX774_g6832 [Zancudomyces culisetae]|eukprot:OMH79749.1 hypothetical protein AX774_g6832 [Zancudomyces culisetae]